VTEKITPEPRDIYDETKLAAEKQVLSAPLSTVVLRIARCFPEPPQTEAAHRLYRGVRIEDVSQAHLLALTNPHVIGALNIAGAYIFTPADTAELWADAPTVIARKAPHIVEAFHRQGWALPARIDRVYDSSLAQRELGYSPA
jgi:nucleoside-diphosphate-sugar epimerase